MPLTAAQIVALATQDAKCPGFTSQAGQFLNAALQDYCQNYDLDAALGSLSFTFNSGVVGGGAGQGQGSGPYQLPADYLRTQVKDGKDEFFYTIQGVPYPLIQVTKAEYDWLVQTPGFQSYPYNYATDLSTVGTTGYAELFVWPPASGAYPATLRYYRLMPDIATPETSNTVPWFLNNMILQRDVAGRLMGLTGDDRQAAYLGDDEERYPLGVGTLMKKYLKNVEDREGAVHTVGKDRRRWGRPFDQLKNTKNIGWCVAAFLMGALMYFGAPVEEAHAACTPPCTKSSITTDINTNWPDNGSGLITPALLRSTVLELVNSYLDVNGSSSFNCPSNQFLISIATLSTYTCAQPTPANLGFANFGIAVLTTASGGMGYPTGAGVGGAVTQLTSRSTGVTLNNLTGAITLVSAAGVNTAGTAITFTVTDSLVAATDVIHVSQKSGTDKWLFFVTAVGASSFNITGFTTGGTTTEQPVINFAVFKGSAN